MGMLRLRDNKKYALVMFAEFIFLSVVYWSFFAFTVNFFLSYMAGITFFVAAFNFWMYKYNRNEHFFVHFTDHFMFTCLIFFLFFSVLNNLICDFNLELSVSYAGLMVIFILYYCIKLMNQKKSGQKITRYPEYNENIVALTVFALSIDYIFLKMFNLFGDFFELQLSFALPIFYVFVIALIFMFKNGLNFKISEKLVISTIFYIGIVINSILLIGKNFTNYDSFEFMLLLHLIIMSGTVFYFKLNSKGTNTAKYFFINEMMSLLFVGAVLIFISIESFMFLSMSYYFRLCSVLFAVFFILYMLYYNYKLVRHRV